MSELNNVLNEILVDKDTNLLPENLKAGVTCLGVEGTYEGGSSSDVLVKLFETEDQMQSDENPQEGDKAVIYREQLQSMKQYTKFQVCEFPTTVTLDTAFTDDVYGMYGTFRSVDSSKRLEASALLLQTWFVFKWYEEGSYGEDAYGEVEYTSEDGITYTRTDTLGNPIDLGTIMKSERNWNDLFGKFIFALDQYFGGLFNYKNDVTETSIYKNANYLDDTAKFYKIPKVVSDLFKTGRSLVIPTVVSPNRDYFDVVSGTLYTSTTASYRLVEQPSRTLLAFSDDGASNDESVVFEKIDFDLSLDNPIVAKTNITLADMKTYPYQFKLTDLFDNWYSNIILTDQILVNINLKMGTSVLTTDAPKPSGTVGTRGTYYNVANLVHNAYVYANTQLSKIKENQLFEGLTVYGQDGIVIGDGSIYNNLDDKLLFDALGINYKRYVAPGFDVTDKNIRSLILDNTSNILLPFYNYDNQIATNNTGIVDIYVDEEDDDEYIGMIETQDYIVIYDFGRSVKVDVYSKIDMTLKRSFTIPDMNPYHRGDPNFSLIQNGSKLYSMYACSNGNIVMKGIVLDVDTGEQHVYSKTTTSGTTNSNIYRMCESVTGFVLKGAIGTALSLYLDSSNKPQPMVTTVDFESGTMTIDKKSTSSIVLSDIAYRYNSIVVNDCIYVGIGHNTNLDVVLFRYDVVNNTISSYVLPKTSNSRSGYFVLDENNKWLIPQSICASALSKKALNYETLTVVDIPTDYIGPKTSDLYLCEPAHIVNDVILPIYTMPRWPIGATSLKYGLLTMSTDDSYTVFKYTKDNCILYSEPNNRFIITPYTVQKCSVVEGLVDKTLESYIRMNDGRDYLLLNTTFN